jgi:serine/threonine protein kinase
MNCCLYCSGDLHEIAVFCRHCGGLQEPAFNQLINQTIADRYRICHRLNQDEHSTLFTATDLYKNKTVVIKVSNPATLIQQRLSHSIDGEQARHYWVEMIERMRIETEALMTIRHPNIVRFYDTGMMNDDIRYAVMEYLPGVSLREEIIRRRRIPLEDVMEVMLDLSSALRHVHAHGIVHRDLTPMDIFVYLVRNLNGSQLTVKLTGFGIAKFSPLPSKPPLARHSLATGTITDDPSEQCENHCLDHRSDIYSLGAVVYEMLTGEPPFKVSMPDERAFKSLWAEPIPPSHLNPDVPPHIDEAILRALAKNPDDRQQSIDELRDQLRVGTEPISFPVCVDSQPVGGSNDRRHRKRRIATAIAIASIAIICGRIFLYDRLLSFVSDPDKKTVISTALPSPSVSSTVTPIELKVRPGTINDMDSSKTTMQPSITRKTIEVRAARPNVQTDALQSRRNETGGQSLQPERKDDKGSQSIKPKMLQWSGTVSRERVVKIDMPGVPGKIEISRASGCSVEITEPPTAANKWRQVTLRVLGQGDASFRLQWWPISRSTAR